MYYYILFEQLDTNGKMHEYKERFENQRARQNFIEQLKRSAKHLQLPFNVLKQWEAPY